jgi:hypothetical protein
VRGNNEVRTVCIAANVVLSGEITEVSFLKQYCSIKLAVGSEVHKNTAESGYECYGSNAVLQLFQFMRF